MQTPYATAEGLNNTGWQMYGDVVRILVNMFGYTWVEAEDWVVQLLESQIDPLEYFPVVINNNVMNLTDDLYEQTEILTRGIDSSINSVSSTMSDVYNYVVGEVADIYNDMQVGYDVIWDNTADLYDDWQTGIDYIYTEVTDYTTDLQDDWTTGIEFIYEEATGYTENLYDDWSAGIDYIYEEVTDYTDNLQDDWQTGIEYIYEEAANYTTDLQDDWQTGIELIYEEATGFIGAIDSTFIEQIDNFMVYFDVLSLDWQGWLFSLLDVDEDTMSKAFDTIDKLQTLFLNKFKDRM